MDREEIYEMVIREMTETAVHEHNEHSLENQELQEKVAKLSKEMQEKIKDLLEDVKKAITDYVEVTLLAMNHDCLYLYKQGSKNCVALLKKLGVLQHKGENALLSLIIMIKLKIRGMTFLVFHDRIK